MLEFHKNNIRTKILLTISLSFIFFISPTVGQSIKNNIDDIGPSTEIIKEDSYSKIFYVSQSTGSDNEGDGSKSNPWKTINYAINNKMHVNYSALYVAKGKYLEGTFGLKPYVDLYGGFNPNTWERDIHKYSTILDGNKKNRVIIGADNARVDGFVITNGFAKSHGGGILCDDASPTISNCFIVNNCVSEPLEFNYNRIHQDGYHGAGIASMFNSVPIIRNNVFYKNKTSIGNGAGIAFYGWYRKEGAPPTEVLDNTITGGLQPLVKNNVFIGNISGITDTNRTRSSNGGAISCAFEARPIIESNIVVNNQAKGRSDAGGIYSEYFSYPYIKNNWILGNTSDDDGGGIYVMKLGYATISNNFIAGNRTLGNGVGGIRLSKEGRAKITGNFIVENLSGGAVQSVDSFMELRQNIIMHNIGKSSIHYRNNFDYFIPSVIENNIIQKNDGKIELQSGKGSEVEFVDNKIDKTEMILNNSTEEVQFVDDSVELNVIDSFFNENSFQTVVEVEQPISHLVSKGRIVNIDNNWGVISNIDKNLISIWGDLEIDIKMNDTIKVISNYLLNSN
ncbi:NosD domain-containing protein [Candidatus Neomarinimicrobiota bacterium]